MKPFEWLVQTVRERLARQGNDERVRAGVMAGVAGTLLLTIAAGAYVEPSTATFLQGAGELSTAFASLDLG